MYNIHLTLSNDEYKLANKIRNFHGTFKERTDFIVNSSIDKAYLEIYAKYNNHYQEAKDLETLKRIIFIQWYSFIEPIAFTGIGNLDEELTKANLLILIGLIKDHALDDEFKRMTFHYYSVTDYYFNQNFDFIPSIQIIERNNKKPVPASVNRGQMGEYWNSISFTN